MVAWGVWLGTKVFLLYVWWKFLKSPVFTSVFLKSSVSTLFGVSVYSKGSCTKKAQTRPVDLLQPWCSMKWMLKKMQNRYPDDLFCIQWSHFFTSSLHNVVGCRHEGSETPIRKHFCHYRIKGFLDILMLCFLFPDIRWGVWFLSDRIVPINLR